MLLTKPKTWVVGDDLLPDDLNQNFDELYNGFNGEMGSENIADGAITTAKIVDGAVTAAKLASGAGSVTGTIVAYAGNTAPAGWFLCEGSALSRTTYAALFAVCGTTYGAGDGSTTFNIPNIQNRIPVGKGGGSFANLGATGGAETHIHGTDAQGNHGHSVSSSVWSAGSGIVANTSGGAPDHAHNAGIAGAHAHNVTSGSSMSPYVVLNYIIKA